jgi:hypothetical protein
MGRFHNYNFGNILEIARQKPDATRVAGHKVKKDERGIRSRRVGAVIGASQLTACLKCGQSRTVSSSPDHTQMQHPKSAPSYPRAKRAKVNIGPRVGSSCRSIAAAHSSKIFDGSRSSSSARRHNPPPGRSGRAH